MILETMLGPGLGTGAGPSEHPGRCRVKGWSLCDSLADVQARGHFRGQEFKAKDLPPVLNFSQK